MMDPFKVGMLFFILYFSRCHPRGCRALPAAREKDRVANRGAYNGTASRAGTFAVFLSREVQGLGRRPRTGTPGTLGSAGKTGPRSTTPRGAATGRAGQPGS